MFAKNRRILHLSTLALVIGLTAGCASTSEIQEVRSIAETAQQNAAEARTSAGEAKSMASAAQSTAESANRKADEALLSANNGNTCCQQNSEKMDRMFK